MYEDKMGYGMWGVRYDTRMRMYEDIFNIMNKIRGTRMYEKYQEVKPLLKIKRKGVSTYDI